MKNRKYKVSVTIRLEENLIEEVDLLAAEDSRSRSQYIENLLRQHIHELAHNKDYDYDLSVTDEMGGD